MNSNAGLSACQVRSLSRLFLESTVHPSGVAPSCSKFSLRTFPLASGAAAGRLRSRGVIAMEPFTNFLTELPLASRRIWSLADGPSWRLEVTLIDAGVAWRFVIAGVPATASTSGVGGVGGAADSGATVAAANRARNEIFIINNNCDDLSQRDDISVVFANFILIIA